MNMELRVDAFQWGKDSDVSGRKRETPPTPMKVFRPIIIRMKYKY
jgi:hypothetical protein